MTKDLKTTAKRLAISLVALSALGGCAVYGPGPYTYYAPDAGGPVVYGNPYYYGPTYVGPPLALGFGFGYWGGWRGGGWHGGGWHGGGWRGGGFRGGGLGGGHGGGHGGGGHR